MLTNNLVDVCMVPGVKNQSAISVTFCALFMTRWILQKLPFRGCALQQRLLKGCMNVTGMVSHGHGDGAYAHYSPHCWPRDSNATISSLARLFCRLEGPSVRESGALLQYSPQNSLFEALLRGKSRCLDLLPRTEGIDMEGRKPLPRKLYLQLDNSAKDNKNKYLMAFLSVLTARGVFEEIQAGFLLVGHTHEDIDAYFSHLSKALKSKNTFVLADLMKAFMQS